MQAAQFTAITIVSLATIFTIASFLTIGAKKMDYLWKFGEEAGRSMADLPILQVLIRE